MASALLTIKQAALFLDVSEATLRRWDRSGRLSPIRHQGNRYRLYDRAQLEACAEELRRAAGESVPPPAPPRPAGRKTNVALTLGLFVGRARRLEALAGLLASGERAVTVLGPPGIGKTRFALRHAELAGAPYLQAGGVWLCDLTHARVPADVASALAQALGVAVPPGTEGDAAVAYVEERLAERGRALVIFDNCEGLARAGRDAIAGFRRAAPEARLVNTSRERLGISAEVVLELEPLELPAEGGGPSHRPAEAVELFLARARAIGGAAGEPDEDLSTIATLVRALDGIPLAIELAAARSRLLTPAELLARLPGRLDVLASAGRGGDDAPPSRHATLRAAIAWSWNLLAAWERSALAQCSVFAGGFSVDAAEAILDLSAHPEAPPPLEVLRALRDKSLLYIHPSSSRSERRLDLYESIRSFALEQLALLELAPATRARHARHYLAAAAGWARALRERGDVPARRQLVLEQDNLLAVLDDASPASADDRVAAVLCVEALFATAGRAGDIIGLLERAAPGLAGIDPARRARGLLASGNATGMAGRLARSIEVLESALEASAPIGDPALEGEVRMNLAIRYRQSARFTEGLDNAERAATLLRGTRAARMEATNLACLGLSLAELGRDAEARVHDLGARRAFAELGDRWSEGMALGNLAQLDQAAGAFEESRWHYERTLERFDEAGDRFYGGVYRGFYGSLEHERGDPARARALYREALASLTGKAAHVEGNLRACSGALEAEHGELDAALAELDRARGLLEGVGSPALLRALEIHLGHADLARARAAAERGDVDAAAGLRARAATRLDPIDPPRPSQDVRFAERLLRRALVTARPVERPSPERAPEAGGFVVGTDARWFEGPEVGRVPLLRRGAVRRLLAALVAERLGHPGSALGRERLLEEGWPGERVQTEAGAKRVRVGIATLRALGLRTLIITRDDGYLLDPSVPLRVDDRAPSFDPL